MSASLALRGLAPLAGDRAPRGEVDRTAAVRAIAERALGPGRLRLAWDARRRLWQAWADAASFARARLRGEWTTEAGALAQLLDLYLQLHATEARRRPRAGRR